MVNECKYRMVLCGWILALVALCAGCGGGGGSGGDGSGGGGGGTTPDKTAPVISQASVSPSTLTALGGEVTITARVTDNVGVTSVQAAITKPDGSVVTVTLSGGPVYTGTFAVPGNPTESNQIYTVQISASDAAGNVALSSRLQVTVSPFDLPPPPPPPY